MTRVLKYSVGDTSPSLSLLLKADDEKAIPLADAIVYAKIRKDGSTVNTNDSNNICTIVSESGGQARYDFVNTDLPSEGKYNLQIQCAFITGRVFTNKENIVIQVKVKF